MPSSSIVYRLTMKYTYVGVPCENVFFYGLDAKATPQSQALTDAFQAGPRQAIRAIMVDDVAITQFECVDVNDPEDFYSEIDSVSGTVIEDGMPSDVVLKYRSNQPFYGAHTASKAFSGVPKPWVVDNNIVGGQSAISTVEDALQATLISGGSSFHPLWVRRPASPNPGQTIPWPTVPLNYWTADWNFWRIGGQDTRQPSGPTVL